MRTIGIVDNQRLAGTNQFVDAVDEKCRNEESMTVTASFDEFNLDVRLAYRGELLEVPERRPSPDEIRDGGDRVPGPAGFMLRRNADRVRSETVSGGLSTVHFHFDHLAPQARRRMRKAR